MANDARAPIVLASVLTLMIWQITAVWASGDPATSNGDCVSAFDPEADYFPDKADIRYAEGFNVSYHGHYKVVTIYSPGEGSERAKDVMVLVQCGAPAPVLTGDIAGATLIEIPARAIGANEDLSLNRVRALGFTDRIIAMGSEGVYAPELRRRWESGEVMLIGASFHGPPNFEKLLAQPPDVLFLSTASVSSPSASIHRSRDLGLPAVPSVSWMEPTPLGQAEWLHLIAVFLNAEAASEAVFSQIEERYISLSQKARAKPSRPTIVWLDPASQRDQWVVPEASWMARLIEDAGGRSPWARSDGAPTRIVTSEDILALGGAVEAMVTTSVGLAKPGSTGPLERAPAIEDNRLFDVHRRSRPENDAYDWYESAVVEVDQVLADFIALLHPDLLPDHEFHHVQRARPSPESSSK
ncbi:MAG: ABC transporter substrate-binding protein [Pseudomonadota bacterium]